MTGDADVVTVLVIHPEDQERKRLALLANRAGYRVRESTRGGELASNLAPGECQVLLVNRDLPDISAVGMLRRLRERGIGIPMIVLVPTLAIMDAVNAIRAGAEDVLEYPLSERRFRNSLASVLRQQAVKADA